MAPRRGRWESIPRTDSGRVSRERSVTSEPPRAFNPVRPPDDGLQFRGFREEAFLTLDRLRARPVVDELRSLRAEIAEHLKGPFGSYRDDLVVHGVLPAGWAVETERGVFSRLAKNDFGAGGAHHHLWMAFYRPPRRRLTDVQIMHSIHPDEFRFGLYISERAGRLFDEVMDGLHSPESSALAMVNDLIETGYSFSWSTRGVTRRTAVEPVVEPQDSWSEDLHRAKALWIGRSLPRDVVIAAGPGLVWEGLRATAEMWPLYRWMASR